MVKGQVITDRYAVYNSDCVDALKGIPNDSVGLSIFSPPFASLYSYSDDTKDMSNSKSYEEFFTHFGFLVDELKRVLMPGRIVAVHCMDLPTFKRNGEEIGLKDFPGDIVRCFKKREFIYHARFCVWKDPLNDAVRTKAIGLAHKQIVKDSTMCRTGIPDYILAFRKKGENPKPVSNENGLTEYYGSRSIPNNLFVSSDQGKNKRSHWIWQQIASPVWFDIRQTRTLNYKRAREEDDERHV